MQTQILQVQGIDQPNFNKFCFAHKSNSLKRCLDFLSKQQILFGEVHVLLLDGGNTILRSELHLAVAQKIGTYDGKT